MHGAATPNRANPLTVGTLTTGFYPPMDKNWDPSGNLRKDKIAPVVIWNQAGFHMRPATASLPERVFLISPPRLLTCCAWRVFFLLSRAQTHDFNIKVNFL